MNISGNQDYLKGLKTNITVIPPSEPSPVSITEVDAVNAKVTGAARSVLLSNNSNTTCSTSDLSKKTITTTSTNNSEMTHEIKGKDGSLYTYDRMKDINKIDKEPLKNALKEESNATLKSIHSMMETADTSSLGKKRTESFMKFLEANRPELHDEIEFGDITISPLVVIYPTYKNSIPIPIYCSDEPTTSENTVTNIEMTPSTNNSEMTHEIKGKDGSLYTYDRMKDINKIDKEPLKNALKEESNATLKSIHSMMETADTSSLGKKRTESFMKFLEANRPELHDEIGFRE